MAENNIYLDFTVTKEQTQRKDSNRIASGTRNAVKARFTLLDDWRGVTPVAIFANGKMSVQVLTVGGECYVPNSMMESEGHFSVCVYGGELKTTTTERARVAVVKSGYNADAPPESDEAGDNTLEYVKTVNTKVKYIRENNNAFEYSEDGEAWKPVQVGGSHPYTHIQETASEVWTIAHNLDFRYVSVTVVNGSGNVTLPEISYTNNNIVTLTFAKATAGAAVIRR